MSQGRRYHVPAVVVGAGLNGLGVVRSLARAGVPVTVVDIHTDAPAMHSRYPRKQCYDPDAPDALLHALESLAQSWGSERAVLFLTQEEAVATLAAHQARLERSYRLTMAATDTVARLLHKDGFRELAEKLGAAVPRTHRLRTAEAIGALDTLRLPWIIKPAVRDAAYAQAFAKAYRVDDRTQAQALLRQMLAVLPDVIVQEWIAGADAALYFCLAYIPPADRMPTTFVGRKLRSWPPTVGGTASCVAAPEAAELARVTLDFFQQTGVTGLASIEYKRDARTGDYLMVEPTVGRTDYQQEIATLNGVNIPLAAYRDALGLAPITAQRPAAVRIWRDRISDLQAAAAGDRVDWPPGARIVDALWRTDDPLPALAPLCGRIQRRLVRLTGAMRAADSRGNTL
jgi:predicted ATP-grasp superfamily ATP-dependent carboligase